MPVFSYKERFAPYILNGSVKQTIRPCRKHIPKPGQIAYNYSVLRTKYRHKINQVMIKDVKNIIIDKNYRIILFPRTLSAVEMDIAKRNPFHWCLPRPEILKSDKRKNAFAWDDGFRPESNNKKDAFKLMVQYYKKTQKLPFYGHVIYW